jgi:hypothetical protein
MVAIYSNCSICGGAHATDKHIDDSKEFRSLDDLATSTFSTQSEWEHSSASMKDLLKAYSLIMKQGYAPDSIYITSECYRKLLTINQGEEIYAALEEEIMDSSCSQESCKFICRRAIFFGDPENNRDVIAYPDRLTFCVCLPPEDYQELEISFGGDTRLYEEMCPDCRDNRSVPEPYTSDLYSYCVCSPDEIVDTEPVVSEFTRGYNSFSGIDIKATLRSNWDPTYTKEDLDKVREIQKPSPKLDPNSIIFWDYQYPADTEEDHTGEIYNPYTGKWRWL